MKPNLFGKLMRLPTRFKRPIIHSERGARSRGEKPFRFGVVVVVERVDIGGQTKILLRVSAPPLVNAPAARQREDKFVC